jgi:hypothetical protein
MTPCALRGWVLACGLGAAFGTSATESVGRVDFDLPSPAWKLVAAREHALHYQNGTDISLFTKIYTLPGAGPAPKAMLIVTSTGGSHPGRTQWVTDKCPEPRPKYFATDFDSNKLTRVRECIIVNPDFAAAKYFVATDPVLLALKEGGVPLPSGSYSLRAVVGVEGGALVRVHLISAKSFAGLRSGAPVAADTFGVAPELVAWGEALHAAIKESTRLGGRLNLPPIEFKDQ